MIVQNYVSKCFRGDYVIEKKVLFVIFLLRWNIALPLIEQYVKAIEFFH